MKGSNSGDEPLAFRMFNAEAQKEMSISQITELLLKYEERLKNKREESSIAYEKFSSDMAVIESELDKKMKDKF